VASTTTGGLPGPAQIARLPLCIAACTTPMPPVTASRRTSGWRISSWAEAMVGSATDATVSGGPPASTMARLMSRTAWVQQTRAEGWTLKTTLFPAATMPMVLQMMVEVGFVDGVIAPMTPKGAHSVRVRPRSPVQVRGSRTSGPGVLRVTRRFFSTLSS